MASTYIKRTQVSGSRNKFTFSAWIKRSAIGTNQQILSCYHGNSDSGYIEFRFQGSGDSVHCSGYATNWFRTNRAFRDTNAWYHIVYAVDTTQATSGNRMKLYVNGVEETSFATQTQPSQNLNLPFGESGSDIRIGVDVGANAQFFDGSMSHVHFCDGYTYQPSDFGSTDSTTGEWKINTSPNVSYGNNGFFILKDGNSITDQSGQSHDCTVAGGTLTKTEDCPSNVFATFNPLFPRELPSTVNMGNTRIDQSSSAWKTSLTTIGASSGKYYAEFKAGTISSGSPYKYNQIGVVHEDIVTGGNFTYVGQSDYGWGLNWSGVVNHNNANISGYNSFATGDIICVAMDLDNHKIYWRKNGDAWMNSGNPTSGSTGTGAQSLDTGKIYFFAASVYANECFANFGNGYFGTTAVSSAGTNASNIGIFEYDVPTGYTALSTKGLNL